jgi:hypothetical protein
VVEYIYIYLHFEEVPLPFFPLQMVLMYYIFHNKLSPTP